MITLLVAVVVIASSDATLSPTSHLTLDDEVVHTVSYNHWHQAREWMKAWNASWIWPRPVEGCTLLLLGLAVLCLNHLGVQGEYSVNHYIGSCLTEEWARNMHQQVWKNAPTLDQQQKANSLIHKAISKQFPRYRLDDPRTASPRAYASDCIEDGNLFYGANAEVFADGTVGTPGQIDGSLILEFDGWTSQTLVSVIFAILAGEVLGYPIAEAYPWDYAVAVERMSTTGRGVCNPVHVDMEVWTAGLESFLSKYAGEAYSAGSVGYTGRSGVYTTTAFVQNGLNSSKHNPPYSADFWKDYKLNEQLITALPVSALWNNSDFFPPREANACDDGVMGCHDHCAKTPACTLREQRGGECLVVTMGWYGQDTGYLQAAFANNDIPAYFCFVGSDMVEAYAVAQATQGQPVLFYHYEPSVLHCTYKGVFARVTLPYPEAERVALATGTFDEHGTDNPVDVDFPEVYFAKYGAAVVFNNPPIANLLNRFTMTRHQLDQMLADYNDQYTDDDHSMQLLFNLSCNWARDHYEIWSNWMDPLPMCSYHDMITNCSSVVDPVTGRNLSNVVFQWRQPHPDNDMAPYSCQGGVTTLPEPKLSHLSCRELSERPMEWFFSRSPTCDDSFYAWTVDECDAQAGRTIHYFWLVPHHVNASQSRECEDGSLPHDDRVGCDYLPTHSDLYVGQSVITGVVSTGLMICLSVVARPRAAPVFGKGQHPIVQVVLGGGLCLCGFLFVDGGQPSRLLCTLRPVLLSLGLTCMTGPLLVKSAATSRLSMYKARKLDVNQKLEMAKAMRTLGRVFVADCVLLGCWLILDPPKPKLVGKRYHNVAFNGNLDDRTCQSKHGTGIALVFFWKFLLLCGSLLLGVRNRHVIFDDGEWFWLSCASGSSLLLGLLMVAVLFFLPVSRIWLYVLEHTLILLCQSLVSML